MSQTKEFITEIDISTKTFCFCLKEPKQSNAECGILINDVERIEAPCFWLRISSQRFKFENVQVWIQLLFALEQTENLFLLTSGCIVYIFLFAAYHMFINI